MRVAGFPGLIWSGTRKLGSNRILFPSPLSMINPLNARRAWALLPMFAVSAPLFAQDTDVQPVDAPREAPAETGRIEPDLMESEQLPAEAITVRGVEGWDAVMERMTERAPDVGIGRMRNGAQGTWQVPSSGAAERPHSGTRLINNRWGDTHMGIGFDGVVDLTGAWVAGMGPEASWSPGLRAIGYLDGAEVARTAWFTAIGDEASYFAMNLESVDRVVIESRVATQGSGFYSLDDLTFNVAGGAERTLDFEDLDYRSTLSGTQYAGLVWEVGTGTFDRPATGKRRAPGLPGADAQTGTTSFLGGAGTAPDLVNDFDGPRLGDNGAGFIPPDTCGAVGTDHFVAVVNENISVYDKVTGNRLINSALDTFMGPGINSALDPRVVFDPDSERWIIIGTNFSSGQQIHVAVSTSDDATGTFFKFSFATDGGSDAGSWPDYPTLGVDARGIYTASFMVSGNASHSLFALDKAPLVAANPSVGTVSAFRQLTFEGAIQPAVHWEDDGGAYCVSTSGNSSIRVRRVLPPMTNPTLQAVGFTSVGNHDSPPDAPALGSGTPLDTVSDRLMNSVYRNGSIWMAHCVNSGGRSAGRWYEIDPDNVASSVQQGTISDSSLYYLFPTIAVNGNGDVVVGMSGSNSSQFAGCYVTGRRASDPAGQMAVPVQYQPGLGAYNRLDGIGRNRWGDYSLTSADPTDDTIWTIQERAGDNNNWLTHIAQLEFEEEAIVNYCVTTPNSASISGSMISASGSASVSANDLTLAAVSNPPNAFGLFFYGPNQVQNALGNGFICVGGNLVRLPAQQIDPLGLALLNLDIPNPPAGVPSIAPGETWNFQFWFRDSAAGGAGFDFSDGLSVTFSN